jgi:hypothetical protein
MSAWDAKRDPGVHGPPERRVPAATYSSRGTPPEVAPKARETRSREGVSFDLDELASKLDKNSRFSRNYIRAGMIFFALLVPVGVYLLVLPPPTHVADFYVGPLILVIGSTFIALQGWLSSVTLRPAYRRLIVTAESLFFDGSPVQKSVAMRWTDPAFKLSIYDRTALPDREYDGTARRFDYIVKFTRGPWTPVPKDAFDAIIVEATRHGLRIKRRDAPGGRDPPGRVLVTLSAAGVGRATQGAATGERRTSESPLA